jgi:threonine synthase
MALDHVTGLVCTLCGKRYGLEVAYTCPACGDEGILDVEYDLERAGATLTRAALGSRPATSSA